MALLTDDKVVHLASLRLYTPAQGDPQVTRRQFRWYSVSEQAWKNGSSTLDANGVSLLEWIEGLGIVNRGFVLVQDTALADYTTSGGSWEEERPATGSPRKKRLVQYDATADLQFSAQSTWSHLGNPSFAFSLILPDTPPDHDASTYPPYARIEWSGGLWAIQVGKNTSAVLLKKIAGTWTPVLDLGSPSPLGYADVEEMVFIVRTHRGKLFISLDGGKEYVAYAERSALSVPAGKLTFRGQGGAMAFGVHQVRYYEGVFTSAQRSTFGDYSALTPTIDGRYSLPPSTSLDFADLSVAQKAQWSATLTPFGTSAGGPWDFYQAPELYAARFRYAGAISTPLGTYSAPFDGYIQRIRITKDRDLDQSSATVTILKDPDVPLIWAPGRYPKVSLWLGHVDCNGAEVWDATPIFVGYIELFQTTIQRFRDPTITLTLVNLTTKLKRAKWTPIDRIPLGGQSLNDALDDILATEGLDASYRSWHAAGDSIMLPAGLPEDPFEWPKDSESKWETAVRIAAGVGFELGVTDEGILYSVPKGYIIAGPINDLSADAAAALEDLVLTASLRFNSSENRTAIFVTGELETGESGLAVAIDGEAETNPVSPRFNGLGRDSEVEEAQGTTTAGMLALRAQSMAVEWFRLAFEPDLSLPVRRSLSRRYLAWISGCEMIGIGTTDQWVVLTVDHDIQPMAGESETTVGLVRLQ